MNLLNGLSRDLYHQNPGVRADDSVAVRALKKFMRAMSSWCGTITAMRMTYAKDRSDFVIQYGRAHDPAGSR